MEGRYSGTFTARPGPDLHREMAAAAQREFTSLTQWTNDLFNRAVGWPGYLPRTLEDLVQMGSLSQEDSEKLNGAGLVVICGLMASGRTTLARAIFRRHYQLNVPTAVLCATLKEWDNVCAGIVIDYHEMLAKLRGSEDAVENGFASILFKQLAADLRSLRRMGAYEAIAMEVHARESVPLASLVVEHGRRGDPAIFEVNTAKPEFATRQLRDLGIQIDDDDVVHTVFAHRDRTLGIVKYTLH